MVGDRKNSKNLDGDLLLAILLVMYFFRLYLPTLAGYRPLLPVWTLNLQTTSVEPTSPVYTTQENCAYAKVVKKGCAHSGMRANSSKYQVEAC